MIAKTFEVRDRNTFIPVLAVQLGPCREADRYLLARAGFGLTADEQRVFVQLVRIAGGEGRSECDPIAWADRTFRVAHQFIAENFETLPSGSVVDVEHILGETAVPKLSEAIDAPL